jgi:hypothetical protein
MRLVGKSVENWAPRRGRAKSAKITCRNYIKLLDIVEMIEKPGEAAGSYNFRLSMQSSN